MITFKSKMLLIASIVACFLIQAQGADKYTDENRPYEFGFSIDGEQHRHEKKDENGLIMGEFGFITADGVYHVTVYATDAEGRFKILSMKNIRVKPYPTYTGKQSTTSERQGHALNLPASQPTATISPSTTTEDSSKKISIEPPGRACSSCSLPTTSTAAPIVPQVNQAPSYNPNQVGFAESPKLPGPQTFTSQPNRNSPAPQQSFGNAISQTPKVPNSQAPFENGNQQAPFENGNQQAPFKNGNPQAQNVQSNGPSSQSFNGFPQAQNNTSLSDTPAQGPLPPQNTFAAPETPSEQGQIFGPGSNSQPVIPEEPTSNYSPQSPESPITQSESETPVINSPQGAPTGAQYPESSQTGPNIGSGRSPKRLDESSFGSIEPQPNNILRGSPNAAGFDQVAPGPNKPTLVTARMQIVDKNTDIRHLKPGENEGLPKGLTKDDMSQLLYTFNYTVGFHGHFEEGYTSGVKQGYYFVTGRNGVKTRIDYTADSTGFHPKISQEVLDLLSDDVPKPETEKDEKYGLKGYEFKWLYYPVEDRTS